eukprot:gnl/Chilomastix_cuspidata/3687.p1 GENE.gnl/Chilomastix_cuspidata/3687~~gnl/Chilomastix_cuspidata/3687.p1  ORF type:complete len:1018 (+),score=536.20 gnl/Chilomastix_cuspidata/3687:113-3166(+)
MLSSSDCACTAPNSEQAPDDPALEGDLNAFAEYIIHGEFPSELDAEPSVLSLRPFIQGLRFDVSTDQATNVVHLLQLYFLKDASAFFHAEILADTACLVPDEPSAAYVFAIAGFLHRLISGASKEFRSTERRALLVQGLRWCAVSMILCVDPPFDAIRHDEDEIDVSDVSERFTAHLTRTQVLPMFAAVLAGAPAPAERKFILRFCLCALVFSASQAALAASGVARLIAADLARARGEGPAAELSFRFLQQIISKVPGDDEPLEIARAVCSLLRPDGPPGRAPHILRFLQNLVAKRRSWKAAEKTQAPIARALSDVVAPALVALIAHGTERAHVLLRCVLGHPSSAAAADELYTHALEDYGLLRALQTTPVTAAWLETAALLSGSAPAADILIQLFPQLEAALVSQNPRDNVYLSHAECELLANLVLSPAGRAEALARRVCAHEPRSVLHDYILIAQLNTRGVGSKLCALLEALVHADGATAGLLWDSGLLHVVLDHLARMKVFACELAKRDAQQLGFVPSSATFLIPSPPAFVQLLRALICADPRFFSAIMRDAEFAEMLVPKAVQQALPRSSVAAFRVKQLQYRFLVGYLPLLHAAASTSIRRGAVFDLDATMINRLARGLAMAAVSQESPMDNPTLPEMICPFLLALGTIVQTLYSFPPQKISRFTTSSEIVQNLLAVIRTSDIPLALRILGLIPVHQLAQIPDLAQIVYLHPAFVGALTPLIVALMYRPARQGFPFNEREIAFLRTEVVHFTHYSPLLEDRGESLLAVFDEVAADFIDDVCAAARHARTMKALAQFNVQFLDLLVANAAQPTGLGAAFARFLSVLVQNKAQALAAVALPRFARFFRAAFQHSLTLPHVSALEDALVTVAQFRECAALLVADDYALAVVSDLEGLCTASHAISRFRFFAALLRHDLALRALFDRTCSAQAVVQSFAAKVVAALRRFLRTRDTEKRGNVLRAALQLFLALGRTKRYRVLVPAATVRRVLALAEAQAGAQQHIQRAVRRVAKLYGV